MGCFTAPLAPVTGEAKGFAGPLAGVLPTPSAGEAPPNLERWDALLTDAITLLGGERNPELGLPSLNATGEGLDSDWGLRQLTEVSLGSPLAVGVGRRAVARRLSAQSHVAASMGVLAPAEGGRRRALGVDRWESAVGGLMRKGGEERRSRGGVTSLGFLEGGSNTSRSPCTYSIYSYHCCKNKKRSVSKTDSLRYRFLIITCTQ